MSLQFGTVKIAAITLSAIVFLLSCAAPAVKAPESKKAVSVAKVHGDCSMCHESHKREGKILLNKPLEELCYSCHPLRKGKEHVVWIKPPMTVEGLPLDSEGRITCVTCHDPHEKERFDSLLRERKSSDLCSKCHKEY